ncbi:MAG: methyltransferase domain-containing protein [Oscillospiraceae bacterium]|nr:methyltransferase domain-containing protein [Oscillospiraceae bacterium]
MRRRKNLTARMERAADFLLTAPVQPGGGLLIVELGCGMGRFACETAAARPGAFVVGVERVADAVIAGMERARREGLENLRFLLADVSDLPEFFAPGDINELYIHFCDPWPHWKQAPRRLTARNFLQIYRPLLAPDGFLRFKTDNAPLFAFTQKELAAEGWTVTHCDPDSPPEPAATGYELKFRAQGVPIHALTANK